MDFSKQGLLWFVNMVLVTIVVILAVKAVNVWFQENNLPEVVKTEKPHLKQTGTMKTAVFFEAESEFDSVATLNLFSQNRQEMVPTQEPPPPEPEPQPKKMAIAQEELVVAGEKIELHGVVFAEGGKKALLKSRLFKDSPRNNQWVEIGSKFNNLEVLEIEKEQILIKEGETIFPLKLYTGKMKEMVRRNNPAPRQGPKQFHRVLGKPVDGSSKNEPIKKGETYKKQKNEADEEWEIYRTPLGITKRRKTK